MQNSPSQLLMEEHEIIQSVDKSINSIDLLWNKDEKKYLDYVSLILFFMKEYSDKYHHYKEEAVLFEAFSKHPDFMLQGIIDELMEHHEMFRRYTSDIEESLVEKEFEKGHGILKKYLSDLLDHIAIENDELFIMANTLFREDELEKLYFKFQDIDRELGLEFKRKLEKIPTEIGVQIGMMNG